LGYFTDADNRRPGCNTSNSTAISVNDKADHFDHTLSIFTPAAMLIGEAVQAEAIRLWPRRLAL
jgi:hypothetical protein